MKRKLTILYKNKHEKNKLQKKIRFYFYQTKFIKEKLLINIQFIIKIKINIK